MQICNNSEKELFFCLEPWADEKIIPSKKSVEIDLMGPIEGTVAVEFVEQKATLSGWQALFVK